MEQAAVVVFGERGVVGEHEWGKCCRRAKSQCSAVLIEGGVGAVMGVCVWVHGVKTWWGWGSKHVCPGIWVRCLEMAVCVQVRR